ncbi:hypothetical protein B0H13DRAFT_1877036 [Mycena leptocephala]|nr:hypothetical protein B0H13DRAFT_1877036 [Mycena leptocephala]
MLKLEASTLNYYAIALLNIAHIDVIIGAAAEKVYRNLDEASRAFSTLNYPWGIAFSNMVQADIELGGENFHLAKVKLKECLHSAWGKGNQVVSFCLERLANTKVWPTHELQSAWPVIYLGYAHKSKEKLALHKALLFIGDVFVSNHDDDTAHNLFTVALEGFTDMDIHHSRAQCMLRLGDLATQGQYHSEAAGLWGMARPPFQRSLQVKDVIQIDTRLATVEKVHGRGGT